MKKILIQTENTRGSKVCVSTNNDNMSVEIYYQDSKKQIRRAHLTVFAAGDLLQLHLAGSAEKVVSSVVGNIAEKLAAV